MSKTTFSNKCFILGSLWSYHRHTENDVWAEFFRWGDLGLPLAYFHSEGLVTLKPEAKEYVENVWRVFCELIDIDPEGKYDSLANAFDASPNEPLES